MASNSVGQSFQQQTANQHQEASDRQHHCKECGITLNSAESLNVHLHYHKENLLNKWALQAAATQAEESNNNSKGASTMKAREFLNNSGAPTDSSDGLLKKSPEYGSRATPETSVSFGHPPTPQSYHSASSPYQNPGAESNFSPGFQNYQNIKQERHSPNPTSFAPQQQAQPNFNFLENSYYNMDSPGMQQQDGFQQQQQGYVQKGHLPTGQSYRFEPYSRPRQNPQQQQQQVFPAQPTPSPSPKQCDKCGCICETAQQLMEHVNMNHPATPGSEYQQYQMFPQEIKEEQQSDILDLDSHKVHHVYQEEVEKTRQQNGGQDLNNGHMPHVMQNWQHPAAAHQKLFPDNRGLYLDQPKMYANGVPQMHPNEYLPGSHDNGLGQNPYRSFEGLQQTAPPVMPPGPPQVPTVPGNVGNPPPATGSTKSTNWKSNEARRPKTYNCTACNKWFTSSGHLKRHYNTTLHKNAVKSSGQPDPATMPISAHHHPARESNAGREDSNTGSPGEESRGEDSLPPPSYDRQVPSSGLLQQPPNGPYDRQPAPNISLHPPLHSPMPPGGPIGNLTGPTSPPNGEAGLSATSNMDTRGLLSYNNPSTIHNSGYTMSSMMAMENSSQYPIYPNGDAPHVLQVTATNNQTTTGELERYDQQEDKHKQPLPSFAILHSRQSYHYDHNANVGGLGSATNPDYKTNPDFKDNSYSTNYPIKVEHFEIEHMDGSEFADYSTPNTSFADETGQSVILLNSQHPTYSELTVLTHHTDQMQVSTTTISPGSEPSSSSGYLSGEHHHEEQHPPQETHKIFMVVEGRYMETSSDKTHQSKFTTLQPDYNHQGFGHGYGGFSPSETKPEDDEVSSTSEAAVSASSTTAQSTSSQFPTSKHVCYECNKPFTKSCYLTQHNKTFHNGAKPYKCSKCGKRFSCSNSHHLHLTKHQGDKPYKCSDCPKQFNHKTDLRRHMCVHTGLKPFVCDTCGKGFIRKDHMLKHKETHMKKTSKSLSYRCR